MPSDLEEAWNALHDATPAGWFVGRPGYVERLNQWQQYAFDTNDRARPGKPRTREWTAVGTSELHVLQVPRGDRERGVAAVRQDSATPA
jgi:hypothetical protein